MPCASANCGVRRYKWVYGNVFANPYYSGGSWALVSDCNASGDDYICSPSNSTPPGPALGSCGGAFAAYHTWLCSEFGETPGVDCQQSGPHEITGTGLGCFDVACTCVDSGNCGESNCGPTETCCDGTTCVATDSFQTDNNNCGGCGIVCEAGYICVDGECVIDCAANSCTWTWVGESGCCITLVCNCNYITTPAFCAVDGVNSTYTPSNSANCTALPFPEGFVCDQSQEGMFSTTFTEEPCREGCCKRYECNGNDEYVLVSSTRSSVNCTQPFGMEVLPCGENAYRYYSTWSEGPCPGVPPVVPNSWVLTATCPQDCACTGEAPDTPGTYDGETVSHECANDCDCEEGDGPPDPGPDCDTPAPASVTKQPEMMPNLGPSIANGPCSQEECEAHVSTWMAEASGKPNEEGLYKVKWILLDGCPGACCSDQPTQPEFVKKSTLVDAPCKCGCS